jgi:hypothetical protein
VFDAEPDSLPDSEAELPSREAEEETRAICSMREHHIKKVCVGSSAPHLMLTLEDRRFFSLNGWSVGYETWDIGVAFGNPGETLLVVATPGDELVVWAPDSFINQII